MRDSLVNSHDTHRATTPGRAARRHVDYGLFRKQRGRWLGKAFTYQGTFEQTLMAEARAKVVRSGIAHLMKIVGVSEPKVIQMLARQLNVGRAVVSRWCEKGIGDGAPWKRWCLAVERLEAAYRIEPGTYAELNDPDVQRAVEKVMELSGCNKKGAICMIAEACSSCPGHILRYGTRGFYHNASRNRQRFRRSMRKLLTSLRRRRAG